MKREDVMVISGGAQVDNLAGTCPNAQSPGVAVEQFGAGHIGYTELDASYGNDGEITHGSLRRILGEYFSAR
jgi:hypothetical protein